MSSALNLSKYIIYLIKEKMRKCGMDVDNEFDVTPSRLQKLLYFCQAYSLAFTGNKIFTDDIKIKGNRPVIESVNIVSDDVDFSDIDETTRAIVRNVICDKIGMSDYALALAIHKSRTLPECLIS